MKRRERAFTLVEVTVVVAVVLILAIMIIPRFGRVSESARNVVIHNFLKDCRTVYLRLSYGNAPGYIANTNVVLFKNYVAASTLGDVQAQINGTVLTVSGVPDNLFKDKRKTLTIDYQSNTYDGESEGAFLAKVLW
ncbi:MAG: prepilin-type N-terminal cleavage/methylation domain-containing protein [Verrucomicrobia bacterium]|nr:prepilin-type N-terminal cleavage/methylation domain-containing protein [Verrucomicrobiota bacterium]